MCIKILQKIFKSFKNLIAFDPHHVQGSLKFYESLQFEYYECDGMGIKPASVYKRFACVNKSKGKGVDVTALEYLIRHGYFIISPSLNERFNLIGENCFIYALSEKGELALLRWWSGKKYFFNIAMMVIAIVAAAVTIIK